MLAAQSQAFAQNVLSEEANMIREDSLTKRSIEYFYFAERGENVCWDLSGQIEYVRKYPVLFKNDSCGRIRELEKGQLSRFKYSNDSLFLANIESPLQKITYNKPVLKQVYPFHYGDSVSAPFSGIGLYCGDHIYTEEGVSSIRADAYGTIVLFEDTIKNVLRIYTVKTTSKRMDIDNLALDTAKCNLEIEEKYEWYARGYRYPLFETVTITSYSEMTPIGTIRQAYCYLPEEQYALNDSTNREILKHDSIAEAKIEYSKKLAEKDIIHYDMINEGGIIDFNYTLDKNADIMLLVCNSIGIIYKRQELSPKAGCQNSIQIDCSSLKRGQYIMYINVNGMVYNEKINL